MLIGLVIGPLLGGLTYSLAWSDGDPGPLASVETPISSAVQKGARTASADSSNPAVTAVEAVGVQPPSEPAGKAAAPFEPRPTRSSPGARSRAIRGPATGARSTPP